VVPERDVDDVESFTSGMKAPRRDRDPLRYVFESSVHAKRMQARPPTSRPAGGVVRGGYPERGAVDGGLRARAPERAGLPAVGARA